MKVSEIKSEDVIEFLKLEPEIYQEETGKKMLAAVMSAAGEFIEGYTGLSEKEIDSHEDFFIAYMALCQDMIDNRSYVVDKSNINKVVDSILGMHSINLL